MNWYVVKDLNGRIQSAHFDSHEARKGLKANTRIHVYGVENIVGWILCVLVFGGIGLMMAWRG